MQPVKIIESNGYWLYHQVVKDDCVLSDLDSCRISVINPTFSSFFLRHQP